MMSIPLGRPWLRATPQSARSSAPRPASASRPSPTSKDARLLERNYQIHQPTRFCRYTGDGPKRVRDDKVVLFSSEIVSPGRAGNELKLMKRVTDDSGTDVESAPAQIDSNSADFLQRLPRCCTPASHSRLFRQDDGQPLAARERQRHGLALQGTWERAWGAEQCPPSRCKADYCPSLWRKPMAALHFSEGSVPNAQQMRALSTMLLLFN